MPATPEASWAADTAARVRSRSIPALPWFADAAPGITAVGSQTMRGTRSPTARPATLTGPGAACAPTVMADATDPTAGGFRTFRVLVMPGRSARQPTSPASDRATQLQSLSTVMYQPTLKVRKPPA